MAEQQQRPTKQENIDAIAAIIRMLPNVSSVEITKEISPRSDRFQVTKFLVRFSDGSQPLWLEAIH